MLFTSSAIYACATSTCTTCTCMICANYAARFYRPHHHHPPTPRLAPATRRPKPFWITQHRGSAILVGGHTVRCHRLAAMSAHASGAWSRVAALSLRAFRRPVGIVAWAPISASPSAASTRAVSVYAMKRKAQEEDAAKAAAPSPYDAQSAREKRMLRGEGDRAPVTMDEGTAQTLREMRRCMDQRSWGDAVKIYEAAESTDGVLRNMALNACAKGFLYDKACQIWVKLQPEEKDIVAYSAMIDAARRVKKVNHAESLFAEMSVAGLEPNIVTYSCMIGAYSASGRPEDALRLFHEARQKVFEGAMNTSKQMLYTVAMSATARLGDYRRTRELFVLMGEDSVPVNNMHANALLTSCAGVADAATAQSIFEMLPLWGLKPRPAEYNILLSCCRNDLEKCKHIWAEMHEAGCQPNWKTNQTMLEAHVLAGDGPGAKALLDTFGAEFDWESRKAQTLVKRLNDLLAQPAVES